MTETPESGFNIDAKNAHLTMKLRAASGYEADVDCMVSVAQWQDISEIIENASYHEVLNNAASDAAEFILDEFGPRQSTVLRTERERYAAAADAANWSSERAYCMWTDLRQALGRGVQS